MTTAIKSKLIASCALLTAASSLFAHENHGLTGNHWHATDAWGFVALAGLVALAVWFSRGGK